MLCIFLAVAYPYDRLLEPQRASKRNYNHFQRQTANFQENKSETFTTFLSSSSFFLSETYCQFHLPGPCTKERERERMLLQLIPKFHAICLFDTNQKVKIYIMDDTDAVNLLAHVFRAHTERINILCPLRHKGRQAELADFPACWSHPHWRRRGAPLQHIYLCSCSTKSERNVRKCGVLRANQTSDVPNATCRFMTQPHKCAGRDATACLITNDACVSLVAPQ